MARDSETDSLALNGHEALIAIFVEEDGRDVVRYFASEVEARRFVADKYGADTNLAGAWSDLDWDEMEAALYRIRHESRPTPPIIDL